MLASGTAGVQVASEVLELTASDDSAGTVGVVMWNTACTGKVAVALDANAQAGVAELNALAGGLLLEVQRFKTARQL